MNKDKFSFGEELMINAVRRAKYKVAEELKKTKEANVSNDNISSNGSMGQGMVRERVDTGNNFTPNPNPQVPRENTPVTNNVYGGSEMNSLNSADFFFNVGNKGTSSVVITLAIIAVLVVLAILIFYIINM